MKSPPHGLVERFAGQSREDRIEFLSNMSPSELLRFDSYFDAWATPAQLPPKGEGWRTWLLQAGRGFGKTRAGAEWVHNLGRQRKVRIALVGATIDEARAVMVEGVSGLLAVARVHGTPLKWEASLGRVTWPNGSVATLFSGDNGDGLRGPEHAYAWCDELAKWGDADNAWDNLQLGLRMGPRPRALVTTTPRNVRVIKRLRADPATVVTYGRTSDNVSLPAHFLAVMEATYAGTALGRQELDGVLIEDVAGSLWPRAVIERQRCGADDVPELDRIVVGVDPPAGSKSGCDACGIIVAGRIGEQFYVLADRSVETASPERWGRAVAAAVAEFRADRIVAEANNGGDMVRSVLEQNGAARGSVRLVHASRGKAARAEPVAMRFESGHAWFAGGFAELEDELSGLCAGGAYDGPGRSPDRADAMVWAMTELGDSRSGLPRVMRL